MLTDAIVEHAGNTGASMPVLSASRLTDRLTRFCRKRTRPTAIASAVSWLTAAVDGHVIRTVGNNKVAHHA